MSYVRVVAAIAVVSILGAPAMAEFLDIHVQFSDPEEFPGKGKGPHGGGPPEWAGPPAWSKAPQATVEMVNTNHEKARLRFTEGLGGLGIYNSVIDGNTGADPIMHIVKEIENASGVTWTSYEVTLDGSGGAEFVTGGAASDLYTNITEDTLKIVYSEPGAVPHGTTVTIEFDINVPTTGFFGFTLSQMPIPEPATLGLLALGGAFVLTRRKRRQ